MKKLLKISLLLIVFFFSLTSSAEAQNTKYGYLNLQELIVLMPAATAADKTLEKYQTKIANEFQAKVTQFEKDAVAFQTKVQSGGLNQIEMQTQGQALGKREQELAYEQQYGLLEQIEAKRAELLKPILEKVDKVVKEIGKEQGYTMIFDSAGMNAVLYHDTSVNVMDAVKAKLGL